MPPLTKISLRLKNGPELVAAMRRMSILTGTIPSAQANRACFSIAARARSRMPTTDAAEIRKELAAVVVPGGGPTGAMIINSRVGSDGFWSRGSSPFKGVSREEGARKMLEEVRNMTRARVRSRGYFKVTAAVVMQVFKRAMGSKAPSAASEGTSVSKRIGKLADGRPATGRGRAIATFWVSGTRPDDKEAKSAIFKVAEPVWQEALDHERQFLVEKANELDYKQAIRLAGLKI